jgi:putative RecB family exonuclease
LSHPDFGVVKAEPGQNWLDVKLEPPPYMSASSIDTFLQCPLKYKLSRIDKLADPPTPATVLGNFVHSVMEDLFALPPEERTPGVVRTLLSERWENEYKEIASSVTSELKEMKWKAFWCLENYFEMEDPTKVNVTSENIETELNVEVAGVPIKGFVDQWRDIGNGLLVRDWKTGKSPRRPEWAESKFLQLLIYADGLSSLIGKPAALVSLYFVADKVKLEKEVTQDALEEMRAVVARTRAGVLERCETGEFEPVPQKLCNWCSYQSICPAFK